MRERLRARMARLGLQQNELAERLGVGPSAIGNWLSGLNAPKGRNLRKLAEMLDCDAWWIAGEDAPSGPAAVEDSAQAEVRRRCHRYVDRVLNGCHGNLDRMTWTLVELERHFPTHADPVHHGRPADPELRVSTTAQRMQAEEEIVDAVREEAQRLKAEKHGHAKGSVHR